MSPGSLGGSEGPERLKGVGVEDLQERRDGGGGGGGGERQKFNYQTPQIQICNLLKLRTDLFANLKSSIATKVKSLLFNYGKFSFQRSPF